MAAKRKVHTAGFEAPIASAALRDDRTINELAGQYGIHPTLIHAWKKQLFLGAGTIFANGTRLASAGAEAREAELCEQIGRLKIELEWMKKKLLPLAERKRPLIEIGHPELSVRKQCELLDLNRSSHYNDPAGEAPEDLRLIDEQYPARPF